LTAGLMIILIRDAPIYARVHERRIW
jgi:hypothetical protein